MNNHEETKAEYAIDTLLHDKPWKLWLVKPYGITSWFELREPPRWHPEHQYKRKDQYG